MSVQTVPGESLGEQNQTNGNLKKCYFCLLDYVLGAWRLA